MKLNKMTLRNRHSRRGKGGGVARSKLAKRSRYTPKFSAATRRFLKGDGD